MNVVSKTEAETKVKKAVKELNIKAKIKVTQHRFKVYVLITTANAKLCEVEALKKVTSEMTSEIDDIYVTHNNTQTNEYAEILNDLAVKFFCKKYRNNHQTDEELAEIAKLHIQKIINGTHRLSSEFWATI